MYILNSIMYINSVLNSILYIKSMLYMNVHKQYIVNKEYTCIVNEGT